MTIAKLPNIKKINFSNNNIGINGIIDIVSYLKIMPQLNLDLSNNNIDEKTRRLLKYRPRLII